MKSKSLPLLIFVLLSAISFLSKDYFYARLHIHADLGVWLFAASLLFITLICLFLDNQNLSFIGLNLSIKNLSHFVLGFFVATFFTFVGIFITGISTHLSYTLNSKPDYTHILSGLFTLSLPFVIIEELLLRGYAFRKMIILTNLTITNVVFCVAVVIAHWYWWQIWGQPQRMFLAIITASGHLLLGYAFLKSKTIYLPFALHLFGNWAVNYLISSNLPSKSVIVVNASQAVANVYQPYINLAIGVLVNSSMMLFFYFWFKSTSKTIDTK